MEIYRNHLEIMQILQQLIALATAVRQGSRSRKGPDPTGEEDQGHTGARAGALRAVRAPAVGDKL